MWVSSHAAPFGSYGAPCDSGNYAGGFGAGSSDQPFPSTGFGSGSGFGSRTGFGSAGFGTGNYAAGFGSGTGFSSGPGFPSAGFGTGNCTGGFASKGSGFGAGKGARYRERPPAGKAGGRARRPGVDMRCPACGFLGSKRGGGKGL